MGGDDIEMVNTASTMPEDEPTTGSILVEDTEAQSSTMNNRKKYAMAGLGIVFALLPIGLGAGIDYKKNKQSNYVSSSMSLDDCLAMKRDMGATSEMDVTSLPTSYVPTSAPVKLYLSNDSNDANNDESDKDESFDFDNYRRRELRGKDIAERRMQEECDEMIISAKIVGGDEAVDGRFPYAVSLQRGGRHFCGGSLIAPNLVLSVAHCYQNLSEIKAVIGRHDLRNTDGDAVTVKTQIRHPLYESSTTDYDYMIMVLERDTTEDVDFVTISPDFVSDDQAVTTMGYGETVGVGMSDASSYPAPILMHTEVFTLNNEECSASSGVVGGVDFFGWVIGGNEVDYNGMITDNMICAADIGEDSCYGDSGGPLVIKSQFDGEEDRQVGVVSWGYGCAHKDFPGVYARVSAQYGWIKEQVCDKSSSPPESFECDTAAPPQSPNTAMSEDGDWITIYTENFSKVPKLFYQADGSNDVTFHPSGTIFGRNGVVEIHGGKGGVSTMKSNLITMENNAFSHCKVIFSVYSSKFLNQTDTICLDYEINDASTSDVKCWDSSSFVDRKWHDNNRFEFEVAKSENLRLTFQVNGDEDEYDAVLIDSVTIQGKTSVSAKKDVIPSSQSDGTMPKKKEKNKEGIRYLETEPNPECCEGSY